MRKLKENAYLEDSVIIKTCIINVTALELIKIY